MSATARPFKVPYRLTPDWWVNDWRIISTWLYECVGGQEQWDYFNEEFEFKTEAQKTLFMLRWK